MAATLSICDGAYICSWQLKPIKSVTRKNFLWIVLHANSVIYPQVMYQSFFSSMGAHNVCLAMKFFRTFAYMVAHPPLMCGDFVDQPSYDTTLLINWISSKISINLGILETATVLINWISSKISINLGILEIDTVLIN